MNPHFERDLDAMRNMYPRKKDFKAAMRAYQHEMAREIALFSEVLGRCYSKAPSSAKKLPAYTRHALEIAEFVVDYAERYNDAKDYNRSESARKG